MIVNGNMEVMFASGLAPEITGRSARSGFVRIMFYEGAVPDFSTLYSAAEQVAVSIVGGMNIYEQARAYNPACLRYVESRLSLLPAKLPSLTEYVRAQMLNADSIINQIRAGTPTWWLMYDGSIRSTALDPIGLQNTTYFVAGTYADGNVRIAYDSQDITPTVISARDFYFKPE